LRLGFSRLFSEWSHVMCRNKNMPPYMDSPFTVVQ